MIKKTGKGWAVYSDDGQKKLSRVYSDKEEARSRLKDIEYFKHRGKRKRKKK